MFFVSAQIETPTIVSNSSFSRRYQAKDTFGMWERQSCTRSRGRTARVHGPRGFAARAVDAAVLPSSLCRIAYVPYRSENAGSANSGLRWSPKHFVLTILPWIFERRVVSFSMSAKFSAFDRYMLQLPAFCGCSPRCRIVDHRVDLLLTVCRVGGCKFASLSRFRDTRNLVKDYSSEPQACFSWMYEAMWRESTHRLPASCVIVSL